MKTNISGISRIGLTVLAVYGVLMLSPYDNRTRPVINAQATRQVPEGFDGRSGGEVRRERWILKPAGVDVSRWPEAKINFSIERDDHIPFGGLDVAGITAILGDRILPIGKNDLTRTNNDPVSVLLVIDRSKSMDGSYAQTSKLDGAKRAMIGMIDGLDPQALIGVVIFAKDQHVLIEPERDKNSIHNAVMRFKTKSGGTRLYDAADFALKYASDHGLKNIILLSDGCDYSSETRALMRTPLKLEQYKREREQAIVEQSRKTGIRLFTVAIGDKVRKAGNGLYVDSQSLDNMTRSTGFSGYIDLPALQQRAGNDSSAYQEYLINDLKEILTRISESFRFDYSLKLQFDSVVDRGQKLHLLKLNFRTGTEVLPLEIPFTWRGGLPIINDVRVLTPVLIRTPRMDLSIAKIVGIYLILTLLLIFMSYLPSLFRAGRQWFLRFKHRKTINKIGDGSIFTGRPCPNEKSREWGKHLFRKGDIVVICPNCGTAHHERCWEYNNGRCWIRHCGYEMPIGSMPPNNDSRRAA